MQNYAENVTGFAQIKVVKRKSQQLFARQYYFKLLKSNVRTHGFRMQSISITDRFPHSKAPTIHVSPFSYLCPDIPEARNASFLFFFCSIEQTFTNGIYFWREQERLWTSFRYAFPFLQCIYYMHWYWCALKAQGRMKNFFRRGKAERPQGPDFAIRMADIRRLKRMFSGWDRFSQ